MKKFLAILFIFIFTGCMEVINDDCIYSYKSDTRLVKRILYFNNANEIVNQFGGDFSELRYRGRIIASCESENYIIVTCLKDKETRDICINYRNAVIYIDGENSGMVDKYLFTHRSEFFTNYIILRKQSTPERDKVYWTIDKLEKNQYIKNGF